MKYSITLMGAVGGTTHYREQDVSSLLNTEQIQLLHGDTFTGRPGTQVYTDTNTVLKIRSEVRLEPFSAKRWATQALEKERTYQVHHPQKTWFVAEVTTTGEANAVALIGSICPRLQPLHELVAVKNPDVAANLGYLKQLLDHYFRLAYGMKVRLDEGLSNFGISANNQLYYIDDDTYSWDRFVSTAHMLGVYFRSQPWLGGETATKLGEIVHQLILKHFNDAQYLIVLAEQIKDVYFPSAVQRQAVTNFINALYHQPIKPKSLSFDQSRYLAILADIHANLPALETVLDYLQQQGINEGIVLGDIVGYGPHPSQCIDRIQATDFIVLKGNHDYGLASNNFKKGFSRTASWVLQWSMERVSEEQKHWLAELPPLLHNDNWLALHGAPIDPTFFNAYVYEMTYSDNLAVLQHKQIAICFHGHTHQPGIYGRKGVKDSFINETLIELDKFNHALVCPGSIGQPRNGQIGAQFAIYDRQERKIHFQLLPYNIQATIQPMLAEQFPESLISILKGEKIFDKT